MPASPIDLTTIAAVRSYGNVPASVPDATVQQLVTAASGQFLTLTRRRQDFQSAQVATERRDGTGTDSLLLYDYPVVTIDSLLIDNVSVPAAVPGNNVGWICDLPSGLLTLAGGGWPNANGGWGSWSVFPRGRGRVVINYHYGYTAIPDDVAQAVNEMVLFLFKMRDHLDKVTETLAAQVVRYRDKYPMDVLAVIEYYTRKRRIPA